MNGERIKVPYPNDVKLADMKSQKRGLEQILCSVFDMGYRRGHKDCEKQYCEDVISRMEAIEACNQSICIPEAAGRIARLPSVEQKQRVGHWKIIDDTERFIAECSRCGCVEDSRMVYRYRYCCHCGAKMESEEQG